MKLLLVIVAIAVGSWWYFVGGRKLSEADVRAFYRDYEAATLDRNPKNIQIALDGKSATAEVSSSLDVAGSIMNMKSRTRDTLTRRHGRVLLLRTEGTGSVGSGS